MPIQIDRPFTHDVPGNLMAQIVPGQRKDEWICVLIGVVNYSDEVRAASTGGTPEEAFNKALVQYGRRLAHEEILRSLGRRGNE